MIQKPKAFCYPTKDKWLANCPAYQGEGKTMAGVQSTLLGLGKMAILIPELCTKDQFGPSTFKLANLILKLSFLSQIGSCANVVLYISIRQMQNGPFTLSSCRSNMYVLI
jgi:hypothetical protein